MKKLFFSIFVFISLNIFGQEKYYTKTAEVTFEASVPSFEAVKAKHENVTALFNTETGEIAALILIKGFRFKNALMEEHFNENYMESDAFPKASFKGKIDGIDQIGFSKNKQQLDLKGTVTIREITKKVNFKVYLSTSDGKLFLEGDFLLNPSDFHIKVPGIVREKIAEEVTVKLSLKLDPRN
tara:strand:- start:4117 stop:4665 length:549 start_codon:yes stop_codon:yes gene_type:complete